MPFLTTLTYSYQNKITMKKIIVTCLIFTCLTSFGQSVKWGTLAEFSKSNFFDIHRYSCIRVDTNGFYLLHQKNIAQYSVEKFNPTLRKVEVSELKKLPLYRDIRKEIEYVFNINGTTYGISVVKEFKYNRNHYFLEKFNPETLEFEEQEKLYTFKYTNTENEVFNVGFRVSPNKKKLLVTKVSYNKGNENRRYFFAVYNENLELEWDEIIKVPIEKKTDYMMSSDFVLSNSGDVYMYNTISITRPKYPSWKDEIVSLCEKGKRTKIYDLAIKDGLSSIGCEMFLTDKDDLIISGFYTDKMNGAKDRLLGNYHLMLNTKSEEIELETYNPFKTRNYRYALNRGSYNKEISSKKENYTMPKAFTYSGNQLITENGVIYHVVRLYSKEGKITGICVYNISDKGTLEWICQIPIKGNTNIGSQLVDDKLYVVYNDHVGNENLELNKIPKKIPEENGARDGCLVLVTLDEMGNSRRKIVSKNGEEGGRAETFYSFQRDVNFMLLYGENNKKKELYLGLLKLD